MKTTLECMAQFAGQIAESEVTLQKLEWEIEEIGQPAAKELKRRLETLKIEESALKRNLTELIGLDNPDPARIEKIEALLNYMQREEDSMVHEAAFLHQSGHTSAEFVAQAGSSLVELCLRALNRVLGEHRPLGMSVFVNHSHETLVKRFGLVDEETEPATDKTRSN